LGKSWPALDIHVPGCDPQLYELVLAELDIFQPTALQEPEESGPLRAFFTSVGSRDSAARALTATFRHHLVVSSIDIEDEDWAARSQARLPAITIGRLVIAPSWDHGDTYEKRGQSPFLVLIRPSMGFGTGHHATTRLMLKALQELPVQDRTVLDIGCGSGVLAIAAARLGARSAVGVDIDADALANAADNVALNEVSDRVGLEERDFQEVSRPAQIVMANLTGTLLKRSASRLAELVEPQGRLLISGFLESERATVVAALEGRLTLQRIDQEDEWMCAVFVKQPLKD
jgi:ribosomal protein L11 methyltransferase